LVFGIFLLFSVGKYPTLEFFVNNQKNDYEEAANCAKNECRNKIKQILCFFDKPYLKFKEVIQGNLWLQNQ